MFHVGKIVKNKNRYPGPPNMVSNTIGEGLRRHINLCFSCVHFNPDTPESHCQLAQHLHEFSKANGVFFPVVRCGTMEPKSGVEVTDNICRTQE